MLNCEDHELFKQVLEQHHMLIPLIYEPKEMASIVSKQLKDIFFAVYKNSDELFIYPELSFLHSFRTILIENVMRCAVVKQYGYKLHGNATRSFCFAIYLTNFIADCLTDYLEQHPEYKAEFRLFISHANTDLEGLFNETFKKIQTYPKEIMVANSNVVKYFTSLMSSEEQLFEKGLKEVYHQSSALCDQVYFDASHK